MLKGEKAESVLSKILQTEYEDNGSLKYGKPFVCGVYQDKNVYVAFDNRDGYCWVNDYASEEEAIKSIDEV